MVCNRHVSSNRFAPHLAKCMGLGANNVSSKSGNGGLKRKAAVGAATAAALAAAASGSGGGSGSGSQSGIPSKRGRPPKSRGGTGSARSTATPVPGLGHKEGSAAP
ncbi:hypothetical protein BCV69DRAFT_281221 [Microstroma glucosiphilum]|uniref:SAGA-associated factor 11 n=1 Tax=Pseudomicrostroma glucosiphilum TaxID=1684307 RepID=A0A316UBG5_9BASI|nr:hypothetical protein BCV69DRAFT_281221 [Pseudomicrostroma glucosiphilum]PWN22208.1 hypothetical protein BCV69DRAFT_281221 [Pseudomicrostroma glucosiphilum]